MYIEEKVKKKQKFYLKQRKKRKVQLDFDFCL